MARQGKINHEGSAHILGKDYEFEGYVTWYREKYGQDADGNRGEMRTSVEDVIFEKLTVYDEEKDIYIDVNYDSLDKQTQKALDEHLMEGALETEEV